jgi:hypothetical protein
VLAQQFDQGGVLRGEGLEFASVGVPALDFLPLDRDFGDAALFDEGYEVGILDFALPKPVAAGLEQVKQRHQQEQDDGPKSEISTEVVQRLRSRLKDPGKPTH